MDHIIKSIDDDEIRIDFTTPKKTTIDTQHYDPIIEGMHNVYNEGTASFLKVPGIEVCGKTGTAENFTKVNGIRKQLTDHSIFIAFAPKKNPKIAIAVLVENGHYGARWSVSCFLIPSTLVKFSAVPVFPQISIPGTFKKLAVPSLNTSCIPSIITS